MCKFLNFHNQTAFRKNRCKTQSLYVVNVSMHYQPSLSCDALIEMVTMSWSWSNASRHYIVNENTIFHPTHKYLIACLLASLPACLLSTHIFDKSGFWCVIVFATHFPSVTLVCAPQHHMNMIRFQFVVFTFSYALCLLQSFVSL